MKAQKESQVQPQKRRPLRLTEEEKKFARANEIREVYLEFTRPAGGFLRGKRIA